MTMQKIYVLSVKSFSIAQILLLLYTMTNLNSGLVLYDTF